MILRRIAQGAIAAGVLLIVYNSVQRIEANTEARIAAARAEERARVTDGCWPQAGQTVMIVGDGQRAHCRTYTSRSLSPGMAPVLVSAATVEGEQ